MAEVQRLVSSASAASSAPPSKLDAVLCLQTKVQQVLKKRKHYLDARCLVLRKCIPGCFHHALLAGAPPTQSHHSCLLWDAMQRTQSDALFSLERDTVMSKKRCPSGTITIFTTAYSKKKHVSEILLDCYHSYTTYPAYSFVPQMASTRLESQILFAITRV